MKRWNMSHTILFWICAALCLGYALIEYLYRGSIEYDSIGVGLFFVLFPLAMQRSADTRPVRG